MSTYTVIVTCYDALVAIGENLAAAGKGFSATQQDHVASINNVSGSLNL